MGFLSPFIYKNKQGQKFWLHSRQRGRGLMYYFSKDPASALNSMPRGFEVVENKITGMPFLKKKTAGGFFGGMFGKPKPKEEKNEGTEGANP